jgi:tRNA (adenine37-N6)-methyltransferase
LIARNGLSLKVHGLDVLDGTPVIDIKPYYPPYDQPNGDLRVPDYVYRLAY